ncbi:hypothetical protein ACIQF5_34960 [Streptomyces goshikiensis]|uniref:hypothetical protein n=1 Tax=Streptomyces goshikiensis TaxID=1942 RepID=UPI00382FA7E5
MIDAWRQGLIDLAKRCWHLVTQAVKHDGSLTSQPLSGRRRALDRTTPSIGQGRHDPLVVHGQHARLQTRTP